MSALFSLVWMPDVLRAAGCTVAGTLGWSTRGHGDFGPARGVLLHHTAGPAGGDMPSLKTLIQGRPDLAGPLCNLGLSRDGTFFAVAAGRAYHAGYGWWPHDGTDEPPPGCVTNGNSQLIGIECENTGLPNDPWPERQKNALLIGVAALLRHIGAPIDMCAGHKEYARNPDPKSLHYNQLGRKTDPSFDMTDFRARLGAPPTGDHSG